MMIVPAGVAAAAPQGSVDNGWSGERNLALGRPATQSSISAFSQAGGPSADAVGAVLDTIPEDFGFHTDLELHPWWQVDLCQYVEIRKISIYNRKVACERLRHFSILLSEDGEKFEVVFRKLNNEDFGADGKSMDIEVAEGFVTRFVRIRADAYVPLHLRHVEVFGVIADEQARWRYNERIRREALAVKAHAAGRNGAPYDIGGFQVFGDIDRYSSAILGAFQRGDYEGREREVLRSVLSAGDRVLEVGCAVGAVAMTCAAAVGAEAVRCFDANPEIIEDARRNFAANDFGAVKASAAVLVSHKDRPLWGEDAEFLISRDFWSSRLSGGADESDIVRRIRVPVLVLEEQIRAHGANVLVCDIEGGEIALLMRADLSGISKIVLETHYWAVGKPATSDLVKKLITSGFDMDLDLSHHHVSYFTAGKSQDPVKRSAWRKIRERIGIGT